MAHMIPETMLEFDPKSREHVIFKALRKGLDDGYWVFHSFSVNQTSQNGAFYEGASRARQKLVVFAEMTETDCAFVLDAFAVAGRYKANPSAQSARQRLADFLQMAIA